jgi:hypothetical protein
MTEEEYKLVTRRMRSLWPSLGSWMASLDEEAQEGIRERWRMALLPIDKNAAEHAIGDLAKMDVDHWPYPSDKERAAAIVAAKAREIARATASASRYDAPEYVKPRKGQYKADGTFGRILAKINADERHTDECQRFRKSRGRCHPSCPVPGLVGKEVAASLDDMRQDQQRFGCHVCRDTGWVSCYRSRDVYWIAKLRRLPVCAETYAMRCSCRAAQKPREPDGRDYDRNRDVAYHQLAQNVISDAVSIYSRIEDDATRVDGDGRIVGFDLHNNLA